MARESNREASNGPASLLTRSESLAVIQTCLLSCLSAVLSVRAILPHKAFDYENLVLQDSPAGAENVDVVTIRKDRSKRGNHLLKWLVCTQHNAAAPSD